MYSFFLLLFSPSSHISCPPVLKQEEAAGQGRLPSILHVVVHISVHSVLPPDLGAMFWILSFLSQVSSDKPLQSQGYNYVLHFPFS